MPKIYPPVAAILLLAGCQQAANEAAPAENGISASNALVPPPAANSAGKAQEGNAVWAEPEPVIIPAAFIGVYDRDAVACASAGSEERLRISPLALHFHESAGEVRSIRTESDRTIAVEADFQGEGESWRNILRLSLSAGGTLTVTQPDGSSLTRIPCPEGR